MPKYKEEQESRYISRTVAILSELPEFCTVFYDKNQTTFLPKTQYDYMRAMRSFLTYQQQSHPYFNDRELADYTLDDLEHLTVKDANNFIEWLQQTMSVSSVKTRISCISSIFTFFARNGQLTGNPFLFANRPDQGTDVNNAMKNTNKEYLTGITEKVEKHKSTDKKIDTNIDTDLNADTNRNVYRTKQRSTWITMSEALTDLIKRYLEERSAYLFEKDAEAMFLVTIGRYKGARLGVRSIERIVSTIRKRQL